MIDRVQKIASAVLVLNQETKPREILTKQSAPIHAMPSDCRALVPMFDVTPAAELLARYRPNTMIAAHLKACTEGGRHPKAMRLGKALAGYGAHSRVLEMEHGVLI